MVKSISMSQVHSVVLVHNNWFTYRLILQVRSVLVPTVLKASQRFTPMVIMWVIIRLLIRMVQF